MSDLHVGVAQTAYANGASSDYLRGTLKVPVALTKTGVKYLHARAHEFGIGVYFEANGHGTVLFSNRVQRQLHELAEAEKTSGASRHPALKRLLALTHLINQATGDALSDLLAVDAVLCIECMTCEEWEELYTDLPSRQTKVRVADRTAILTTPDETRTTAPAALQPALDAIIAEFDAGRAFVRPSGTEDVVRVYAEARTQALADRLAARVARCAWELAGGVGEAPPAPEGAGGGGGGGGGAGGAAEQKAEEAAAPAEAEAADAEQKTEDGGGDDAAATEAEGKDGEETEEAPAAEGKEGDE